MPKRGSCPRTALVVLSGVTPLVLEGCKFNDQMSSCEKAGLGTLYVLGALAAVTLIVGLFLLGELRR